MRLLDPPRDLLTHGGKLRGRMRGARTWDRHLAERYEQLLTRSRGVRLVELTRDQLRAAAQLRAVTGVKTPDALQLTAALGAGCKTFVTNDRRLPPVPGLRVLQLSSYIIGR